MASKREDILSAIVSALSAERDTDIPEAVPARGLLIVRSAAAEIDDATLGGSGWYMRIDVPVEVYARTTQQIDALVTTVANAVPAALQALATYVEPTISEVEPLAGDGRTTFATALMLVRVEFDSATPVG